MAYGSCVAETNSYCFAYAACENVITDFEMNNVAQGMQVEEDPDGMLNALDVQLLSDTCSKDNIATLEGIRDCTAFCQHHLCCFSELEGENCVKDHVGECQAYDSCQILVDGPEDGVGGDGDGDENKNGGNNDDNAPTSNTNNGGLHTFKTDCLQNNFKDNWDLCKNHCSRFECCFSGVDSCYKENALECDEYYLCEEFYLDDKKGDTDVSGGGASNQIAAPSENDGANDHTDSNVNAGIENAVHAVCGLEGDHPGDDSWVTACHALCANYLCCFSTDGTQSNCRDAVGDDVCNAYQECVVLLGEVTGDEDPNGGGGDDGTTTKGQEVEEVEKACVSQARRDPRLADQCRKACDARSCCFNEGPYNCSSMNAEWCEEFAACELLYT